MWNRELGFGIWGGVRVLKLVGCGYATEAVRGDGVTVSGWGGNEEEEEEESVVDYLRIPEEKLVSQCEIDTFKSSGPGGQHRNKRETAVRIKHRPTGIIAQVGTDSKNDQFCSFDRSLTRTKCSLFENDLFIKIRALV